MSSLRTGNTRAKRAEARRVYADASAFHIRRCQRLAAHGRLDKLKDSAFVRRHHRKEKARHGTV